MLKYLLWLTVIVVVVLVGIKLVGSEEANVESVQPAEGSAYFLTEAQADEQGAVTVSVTQLNLNGPTETLDFNVVMDTHSVDLSMDLAEQAELTTDTGLVVTANGWDGARGGHHVSGTLSFPAVIDGETVLNNVTRLTLTLRDVDAAERVFTWQLQEIE